jgi:ATP-dependent DNA helicase RecG
VAEKPEDIENQRLQAMATTNDGFKLAEMDLEQRGAGDFLGTRQSGFGELQLASLTNLKLIENAQKLALTIFEEDPGLQHPKHAALAGVLQRFWTANRRGDIS